MKIDTTCLSPKTVNDFLFNNSYDKMLLEDIVDGVFPFPSMGKTGICLHGTYGTGKTTLALRLPDLLDSTKNRGTAARNSCFSRNPIFDLTLCKSGNDSIQQVKEIADRVDSRLSFSLSGWHFEVLDEADLLTEKAQDMLKSLMTFNKDTIFVMTTNHPSKFSQGLVNRCHMIEMNAVSHDDLVGMGKQWMDKLRLSASPLDENELLEIAERSRGSIRDFGNDLIRSASKR